MDTHIHTHPIVSLLPCQKNGLLTHLTSQNHLSHKILSHHPPHKTHTAAAPPLLSRAPSSKLHQLYNPNFTNSIFQVTRTLWSKVYKSYDTNPRSLKSNSANCMIWTLSSQFHELCNANFANFKIQISLTFKAKFHDSHLSGSSQASRYSCCMPSTLPGRTILWRDSFICVPWNTYMHISLYTYIYANLSCPIASRAFRAVFCTYEHIFLYTCMLCIAYIHTHMHISLYTHIHAYISLYIQNTCKPELFDRLAYLLHVILYIHAYKHLCKYPFIYTYMHMSLDTGMPANLSHLIASCAFHIWGGYD